MLKNTMRAICALVLAPVPLLLAGESTGKEVKKVIEAAKESCITGDIGVSVVSQYISRGVIFENQGLIAQPFADLYFKLYEGEGFINKVSLNLGIWSSIHSRKTDAGIASGSGSSTTRNWYEFDYTVGLATTFAKNFTFTPSFYAYLSPNDGFSTFYGLNLNLAYNDSDLWGGKFALNPSATVLFELENKTGTGADEGVYYEVALNPTFALGPATIAVPLKAGFGSSDFYGSLDSSGAIQNEGFGYLSAGVVATLPLKFIPECYGAWTLNASATYYYLGDGTADYNTAPRGGTVRDYSENEWVFGGGLTIAF
jgi:hypothetical protein